MEGGGDYTAGKGDLRQGMSYFLGSLREAVRQRRLSWKIVPCGSRTAAHEAFLNATRLSSGSLTVLLVDAESPVANLHAPRAHLSQRDGWTLADIGEESVHLMIQVMETWMVTDAGKLAEYYGQGFVGHAIPQAQDLEGVGKEQIYDALKRATARTQKGEYHKIRHAADLLKIINPAIVRQRCPSCDRIFTTLERAIREA